MSATRSVYKIFRSILFTAVLAVIGIFASVYVALSIPAVQNKVKEAACRELTSFFGGRVEIGTLQVFPFSELRLFEVAIYSPGGERCVSVGRLGAGISLWSLISEGKIEITYAEIISLDARISQPAKDSPLNIDFIIKAFAPKDKNKPPAEFNVVLRNVVIRKSRISFDRQFIAPLADKARLDFNHLDLSDVRADIAFPVISNDDVKVDLRRLAFTEKCGLAVNSVAFEGEYSPEGFSFSDFRMRLADSDITVSDQKLNLKDFKDIREALFNSDHQVELRAHPLVPADLACFYPPLAGFQNPSSLSVDIAGKISDFVVRSFSFEDLRDGSSVSLSANVTGMPDFGKMKVGNGVVRLVAEAPLIMQALDLVPSLSLQVRQKIAALGDVEMDFKGDVDMEAALVNADAQIVTNAGSIDLSANLKGLAKSALDVDFSLAAEDLDLASVLENSDLGLAAIDSHGRLHIDGKDITGNIDAEIPLFDWKGTRFENISVNASKSDNVVEGSVRSSNPYVDLAADGRYRIAGAASEISLSAEVARLYPALLGASGFAPDEEVAVKINADVTGNTPDNFLGTVNISGLSLKGQSRNLNLSEIAVSAVAAGDVRSYTIDSDFLNGKISGTMKPSQAVIAVRDLLAEAMPSFFHAPAKKRPEMNDASVDYDFTLKPSEKLFSFLKAPVRPGVPVTLSGYLSHGGDSIGLFLDAPYIIQGRNKLLKNTSLTLSRSPGSIPHMRFSTDMPVKNDRAVIDADISAVNDSVDLTLSWTGQNVTSNKGLVSVGADISRNPLSRALNAVIDVNQSHFSLHGADWDIMPAHIVFADKVLDIDGLKIKHDTQFVDIYGRGSDSPADVLNVALSGIDLEYIFNILNIENVNFGGIATGHAKVTSLFTKAPVAMTDGLFVKDLAYNNCVLGNGALESHWDNAAKMVAINADIDGPGNSAATVRGGVYVTRDSLSFDFGARHIDIAFLQPFMSGFTSSVKGHASGNIKLYGTFSDIDLGGAVHADDIEMLVDQSNVRYHGADSLFFTPGRISIPDMTLFDRFGNSCRFGGEVTHNYLKDASFSFRMTDARKLLVFDTDARDNPKWYGRIFAEGSAALRGVPGFVSLSVDMSTAPDSEFTFVLDETEEATEYTFLTFTDRRKEEQLANVEVSENFEDLFYRHPQTMNQETPTAFLLDMALDVTPATKMVIVMDPKAGDKISANGAGALRMRYDTGSDALSIYGKYSLLNGWYNFSLQDLILKNFKIEEGSSISFNGDPLRGVLDITAAYRVNTNLRELDSSFESDPELKRTFVPVDALLKVTGDIHAPEIKFDIALPTVTSEVERKMRSIISTEDMLNRQVIYLLALNRFYTPEYMGSSQGSEIASVASSTLSSQVQNIIGSLTDRFTLAPSFKSEKSDLSDMEVDLALSSSFFDNRLLLNGNLGYRDKSTSQTTFIGDFDLEYLLSRDGRLRLKAYNHFNDASYYLRSALTTQGIGIVYRKDFDDPLKFIKRLLRRWRDGNDKNAAGGDSTVNAGKAVGNKEGNHAGIHDKKGRKNVIELN